METIKTASVWADKVQVKKGSLGESLVDQMLIDQGYIPYRAIVDEAHPFDRLCTSKDKRRILIAEVKTKPRRKYYPDTGINLSCYRTYKNIMDTYGIPVWLFFVDEDSAEIYGGELADLETERHIAHKGTVLHYPLHQGGIVYFPRIHMKTYAKLPVGAVTALNGYSTREIGYAAIPADGDNGIIVSDW
jgi:hypothetical protein